MLARHVQFSCGLFGVLAFGSLSVRIQADTAAVTPVADATLIETEPDNNNGGQRFVNAGTTQNFTRNRGLFRFDIAAHVPAGSKIIRAELTLEVVHQPPQDGYRPSGFDLHRLLESWGEGNKTNSASLGRPNPGLGEPATPNEATWNARFAFTTNLWKTPGGATTSDYSPEVSAETTVYGVVDSPYTFASTPLMIADVQLWLDHPENNFGWMLKSLNESVNWTACSFGSREDTANDPLLTIEYEPPRIDGVQKLEDLLTFSFAAQAGQAYAVEFLSGLSLSNNWSTLTNVPAHPTVTNVVVSDPITDGERLYRLRIP